MTKLIKVLLNLYIYVLLKEKQLNNTFLCIIKLQNTRKESYILKIVNKIIIKKLIPYTYLKSGLYISKVCNNTTAYFLYIENSSTLSKCLNVLIISYYIIIFVFLLFTYCKKFTKRLFVIFNLFPTNFFHSYFLNFYGIP